MPVYSAGVNTSQRWLFCVSAMVLSGYLATVSVVKQELYQSGTVFVNSPGSTELNQPKFVN